MDYIYDIVLNFNKEYFNFYEWKKNDNIVNIKKMPLFLVSDNVLIMMKYDKVVVDSSFINLIKDKTYTYNKLKISNSSLFSNGKEVIGVIFNDKGSIIKRSSLLIDEEDEVLEEIESKEIYQINITSHKKIERENINRIEREKKSFLFNFLKRENNINNLKYLYYDYFEEECNDASIIKKKLLDIIKNDWNKKLDSFYDTVKIFNKIKN